MVIREPDIYIAPGHTEPGTRKEMVKLGSVTKVMVTLVGPGQRCEILAMQKYQ